MQSRQCWPRGWPTASTHFLPGETHHLPDRFTKAKRSEIMSHVKGQDTAPERVVGSALHRMGYRFRLHDPVASNWGEEKEQP